MTNPLTLQGLEVPHSSEEVFNDWFEEEREPELDDDVDECIEDDYSGKDFE